MYYIFYELSLLEDKEKIVRWEKLNHLFLNLAQKKIAFSLQNQWKGQIVTAFNLI